MVKQTLRRLTSEERVLRPLGHRLVRGLHAFLSLVFGRLVPLNFMLQKGFNAVTRGDKAFSVRVPYVCRNSDLLRIQFKVDAACLTLPDWVMHQHHVMHLGDYFIGSGDWSAIAEPFSKTSVYQEAMQIHAANFNYQETAVYRAYMQQVKKGRRLSKNKVVLNRADLVESYFKRFVDLFRSIQNKGLLPRKDLKRFNTMVSSYPKVREYRTEWGEREIGVAIGADGSIYRLPGAKHRFAIAIMLGLAVIPVEVRMVHVDWLKSIRRKNETLLESIARELNEISQFNG